MVDGPPVVLPLVSMMRWFFILILVISSPAFADEMTVDTVLVGPPPSPQSVVVEVRNVTTGYLRRVGFVRGNGGFGCISAGSQLSVDDDGHVLWGDSSATLVSGGWSHGAVGRGGRVVFDPPFDGQDLWDIEPVSEDWGQTWLNKQSLSQMGTGMLHGATFWGSTLMWRFFWKSLRLTWFRSR